MNDAVLRFRLESSPPSKPRSGVMWTMATFLTWRCWRSGWRPSLPEGKAARSAITCLILSEYGRPARPRSCALRILELAIISIARVILAVFWTPRIRPRIIRVLDILLHYLNHSKTELENPP